MEGCGRKIGPFDCCTIVEGDCLDVMAKMPDGCVDLVVTSPPYNCRKDYGVTKDEWPWPKWYSWLWQRLSETKRILRKGGTLALVIPGVIRWQRDHQFANSWTDYDADYLTHRGSERNIRGKGRIEPVGFKLMMGLKDSFRIREPIVWVKGAEGQAICSDYRMGCDSDPYMRSCHELILLASKDRWYHDGGTGRRGAEAVPFIDYTKDVWHISPISIENHPAPFPLELPLRLIRLFVHRANSQDLPEPVIFDPFMGTGTTSEAAILERCHFFGCDINSEYVDLAEKRLSTVQLALDL